MLLDQRGDLPVRHGGCPEGIERPDPLRPRPSGRGGDLVVAHAGQPRVVGGRNRPGRFRCSRDDARTGGGVGFARLLHPRTDDALAVFVAGHRHVSFAQAANALPGSVHAATQRSDVRIREYAPLCLTAGPGRGRTSRGWARIDAGISMRRLAGWRQEVCAAQGHTTRIGRFWIALFP